MAPAGIHSACELVRQHMPFDSAVIALMVELNLTEEEAIAAMHAAHERADWGFDRVARTAVRA